MLLVIDVGNTNVVWGVYDGDEMRASWRVATDVHKQTDEYAVLLLNLLAGAKIATGELTDAAICSVVPPLDIVFEELCRRYCGIEPLVVGPGVRTGVNICIDNPREVGADRVVNSAAGFQRYGGPLIVVDFGTGTTFDVVSSNGDYIGGSIAPGIGIAAEALFSRAAKLPRIDLVAPPKAIGTNTVHAMQSGVILGYVGLVESLVARIRRELGQPARVIATGGLASIIAKETSVIDIVDENLTLDGLRLVFELNRAAVEAERVRVAGRPRRTTE